MNTNGKAQQPSSIWHRKRDLMYLVFFLIHLPVMLLFDIQLLLPPALHHRFFPALRTYYTTAYKDRFFAPVGPQSAWFTLYLWMEALYHMPLSVWAIGALVQEHPLLPLHLLIYAVQTGVTTATCVAEYLSWEEITVGEKWALGGLYVPYLAVAVFMGTDMFGRVQDRLTPV